jgi:hypothetical protein
MFLTGAEIRWPPLAIPPRAFQPTNRHSPADPHCVAVQCILHIQLARLVADAPSIQDVGELIETIDLNRDTRPDQITARWWKGRSPPSTIGRLVAIDLHNRLLVTDTRTKAPSLWLTSVAITAQAMARIGQSNALLQKTHSSVTPFARVYSSARASTFNPARAAQVLI